MTDFSHFIKTRTLVYQFASKGFHNTDDEQLPFN